MLALVGLLLCVVIIWTVALLLFREQKVDPSGINFFRHAFGGDLFMMESRLTAHPQPVRMYEDSCSDVSDGDNVDSHSSVGGQLFPLAMELIQRIEKRRPSSSSPVKAPVGESLLKHLAASCCVIPADAANISILQTPTQFFEELKRRISKAKSKIVMSALYVGDGALSQEFLKTLEDKVVDEGEAARQRRRESDGFSHVTRASGMASDSSREGLAYMTPSNASSSDSLLINPTFLQERFTVDFVLDYNRMHDRKNMMTIRRLAELASIYRNEVDVRLHLFQTPSSLNRILAPFGRGKEMLGVQHTKIFTFDDEDVILTGANLSDDYFKNRMDRYMIVESTPELAAWVGAAVATLAELSHRVVFTHEDAVAHFPVNPLDVYSPNISPQKSSQSVGSLPRPTSERNIVDDAVTPTSHRRTPKPRKAHTHARSKLIILPNSSFADPTHDHQCFRETALEKFEAFGCFTYAASVERLQYLLSRAGTQDLNSINTLLFPTLQFGRVGIHHDANVVQGVLERIPESSHVYLTSPYLNMFPKYIDAVIKSKARFDFITASVKSNGWNGQKGFAGQIPFFYLQLERSFYFLLEAFKCCSRVRVREFMEPGMTFHSKGLWIVEDGTTPAASSSSSSSPLGLPYAAAYGSTNYGNRSIFKDVEAEVFLYTWNEELKVAMQLELQRLLIQSEEVGRDRFVGGRDGRFQPVVSLIASMGQDYL